MATVMLWIGSVIVSGWSVRKKFLPAIPTFFGSITGVILQVIGIHLAVTLMTVFMVISLLDLVVFSLHKKEAAFQDYWTL